MEKHIVKLSELSHLVYENVLVYEDGRSLVFVTHVSGHTFYSIRKDGEEVNRSSILSVAIQLYNELS